MFHLTDTLIEGRKKEMIQGEPLGARVRIVSIRIYAKGGEMLSGAAQLCSDTAFSW